MIIFEIVTVPLQTMKPLLSFAHLLEFTRTLCLETPPEHKIQPLRVLLQTDEKHHLLLLLFKLSRNAFVTIF